MTDTQPLIPTPITADMLRGTLDVEQTDLGVLPHRLPAEARKRFPDPQLLMAESQPSGVRVVFRSTATVVELETRPTKVIYSGAPARPDGVYELLVDGKLTGHGTVVGGNELTIDMATGSAVTRPGSSGTVRFDGLPTAAKDIEVWLPHTETTELIALRTDSTIEPITDVTRRVSLHHGSSISHGSNAAGPTSIWPAIAASTHGVDLTNLGLGGSALLDPFTARAIRDADADLLSVKIGINIVNTDLMRLRAFTPAVHGFLDTIREGHPDTPLLVISPIYCAIHENTPGPCAPDFSNGKVQFIATGDPADVTTGKLTLRVIRDQLARIVTQRAATDPHIHYMDGLDLYAEVDSLALPLPDGLHPDAATHRLIGERFARLAFGHDRAFPKSTA